LKRLAPLLLTLLLLVGCGSSGTAQADPPSQLITIQKGAPEIPASQDSAQDIESQTPEEVPVKDNEPDPTATVAIATPKSSPDIEPTPTPAIEPETPKQVPTEPVKPEPVMEPEQTQQPQSQQIDLTGWVEYHTDDLKTLSILLNEGSVINYSGKYYASPEFVKAVEDAEIIFKNDISRETILTPDAEFEIVE
jgi:outer membrane biosynthesis protein TonB